MEPLKDPSHLYEVERRAYHAARRGTPAGLRELLRERGARLG